MVNTGGDLCLVPPPSLNRYNHKTGAFHFGQFTDPVGPIPLWLPGTLGYRSKVKCSPQNDKGKIEIFPLNALIKIVELQITRPMRLG